jgi:signal recognition particle subunit SRP54
MFDGLQDKLQKVLRKLKGEGRISPEVLETAVREIRLALLEADVNVLVVKSFIERIKEKAGAEEVLASLTPAQQVVKIVRDELIELLGDQGQELLVKGSPSVTMLCGLQGSGKTTTAGKLALRMKKRGRQPLLVACDLQRAAAVEQLVQVGALVAVPVVTPQTGEDVLAVAKRAVRFAKDRGHDLLIIDSAGRLHIDAKLMDELKRLHEQMMPTETLFVADAMTGQDAVKSAEEFGKALKLTGAILTKTDGDARGGAALSIRAVTQVPLRYLGTGEKVEDFELFHPDRMTSRILGMGDVLSLIEKAEQGLDADETKRLTEKLVKQQFTLEDLRDQLRQMRKLGPLQQLVDLMPRMGPFKGMGNVKVDDKELTKVEAMINSMTPQERRHPQVLNGRRKLRIAAGSGTKVQDINRLLKQYQMMQKVMKGAQGKFLKRAMGGGRP